MLHLLRALPPSQRGAVLASYLGWTVDAFDLFILVFVMDADGREVYFHRNSVLDDAFEHLTVASEVRFVEEMGEKGPQASTVRLVGKHHLV